MEAKLQSLKEKNDEKRAMKTTETQLVLSTQAKVYKLEKVLSLKDKEIKKIKNNNKKLKEKAGEVDEFLWEALADVRREMDEERWVVWGVRGWGGERMGW